MSAGPYTFCVW